jgi:hypothetical protein
MTQPTRTPELFVEKLAQGELSESAAREVKERLSRESGEQRLEALHRSDADILAEYSPVQMAASIRGRYEMAAAARRRKMSLILLPASAAVAAAAALLFVVMPLNQQDGPVMIPGVSPDAIFDRGSGETVRIKSGGPVLAVGKKTPGGQVWLQSGARLKEGDELQLKFQSAMARHLIICSVDGRGSVTVHFPEAEGDATAVTPGSEHVLPFGYTLDDAPEFERFFVVWSDRADAPVSVEAVRNAVSEMKNPETDPLNLGESVKTKDMIFKKSEHNN